MKQKGNYEEIGIDGLVESTKNMRSVKLLHNLMGISHLLARFQCV